VSTNWLLNTTPIDTERWCFWQITSHFEEQLEDESYLDDSMAMMGSSTGGRPADLEENSVRGPSHSGVSFSDVPN
jgi:hypothetical protein